jgi:hypothetical protein
MSSSTTLSRPPATRFLADMLLALAGAVQELRLSPEAHPALAAVLAGLERSLEGLLRDRTALNVEVGNVQLVVDGMETNADYEPLRDLAQLLRSAGIGGLAFHPGVTAAELEQVFGAIARPERGAVPFPGTPHLTLRPLRPSGPHSADPWLALERLVLDDPMRPRAARDPMELAVGLELHPVAPRFDGRVLELLAQIAIRAVGDVPEAAALDALLNQVPVSTLRRLFAPGGAAAPGRELLLTAAPLLQPRTLLRLCQALAPGREGIVSVGALRLLARLSDGAPPGHRPIALMEEFLRLVRLAYTGEPLATGRLVPEPDRILKLALESGIVEPGAQVAADRMIAKRQVSLLLALLETVPREDPVAQLLRARLFHPQTVRALLEATPVDLDALDRLIPDAGLEAAPALLDALAESRDRRVRLRLLEFLARYGGETAPLVQERLEGMPWYVQRNLLALLGKMPQPPENFSAEALLRHRDPRVRHEAIALALSDPVLRDRGLAVALESDYDPTVALALGALSDGTPPEYVPRIIGWVVDPALDPELRALAVTALAPVKDPVVLRLLRRLVLGRGITGLGRLAPRTPPMLAALRGLAAHWNTHPKVAALLETARQSRDADIREAARLPVRRSNPSATPPRVSSS